MHLFADHRWTGPAEPVVNLVRALRQRDFDARFACRPSPEDRNDLLEHHARRRGVEPVLDFNLNRYNAPLQTWSDMRRLPGYLDRESIDIVHTHLSHDHLVGGLAARRSKRRPKVVRTNHKGRALKHGPIRNAFHRRYTDAYCGFSRAAADADSAAIGLDAQRVCLINPALDLERFDPSAPRNEVRGDLGLTADHVVGGVVARVQRHRRWEVLLEAMKLAIERAPQLRMVVIGRGTHRQRVAIEPAKRMGLEKHVLFPGYRGDDFLDYLAMLDFKVFLMPGSDGTCRAAREAMAMGKPVIAARRGMLPELVADGTSGLVIDDTPQNLADAMVQLACDTEMRSRFGQAAREHAVTSFRLDDQADAVAALYRRLLGRKAAGVGA